MNQIINNLKVIASHIGVEWTGIFYECKSCGACLLKKPTECCKTPDIVTHNEVDFKIDEITSKIQLIRGNPNLEQETKELVLKRVDLLKLKNGII